MIYLSIAILSAILGFFTFKLIKSKKPFVKKSFDWMISLRWLGLRNLSRSFYILLSFLAKRCQKYYHEQGSKVKFDNITKREARELLAVEENASQKEIYIAFCNHIKRNHPNIGDPKYATEKLIETRSIIIKRKEAI